MVFSALISIEKYHYFDRNEDGATVSLKWKDFNMLEHQIWLLEDTEINAEVQAPNKWVNKDTFSDSHGYL